MHRSLKLSRRSMLQGAAGSAFLAGVGMPAIVKAQADASDLAWRLAGAA